MSSFKSTLLSYHEYLNDGLFDEMVMPEGIDTDLLVNVILKECGEMQPVWTNPIFMKKMIGLWSHQYERTFDKWLVAYNAEYNPIYNYDRFEEVEETKTDSSNRELSGTTSDTLSQTISETGSEEIEDSRNLTRSGTDQSTRTDNLTRTDDLTSKTTGETTASSTESLTSESVNTKSAYDVNTYQPHDKTNLTNSSQSSSTGGSDTTVKDTGTVKNTGTVGTSGTNSETVTDGYTSDKETERSITRGDTASGTVSNESSEESSGSFGRSAHLYGNIGVLTTQQMLDAEYSISKWNIYENIKDLFMQEFCIMIY